VLGFQFRDVAPGEFARNEAELGEMLATGRVAPHIGAVYPLAEIARALRQVADGNAVGKVLIEFSSPE
jgi:NADPH2:quinone reductase